MHEVGREWERVYTSCTTGHISPRGSEQMASGVCDCRGRTWRVLDEDVATAAVDEVDELWDVVHVRPRERGCTVWLKMSWLF